MMKAKDFLGTFFIFSFVTGLIFLFTFSFIFYLLMEINFIESLKRTILITLESTIFYSFIMACLFKKSNAILQIQDKDIFLSKFNSHLLRLRYNPENEPEVTDFFSYKPPKGLLAGKISVQIDENSANLAGPLLYINFLQKQFNVSKSEKKSIILKINPDNIQNFVLIILGLIAINFIAYIFSQ